MKQSARMAVMFAVGLIAVAGTAAGDICRGGSHSLFPCTTDTDCPGGTCDKCTSNAGFADCSLPGLVAGKKTYHLYSVPGVLNRDASDIVTTYFSCTSTDTATMQVGVEVFDSNGYLLNDATLTSFSLMGGHSVLFGTHQTFSELFDVSLNTGDFSGYSGSARILATSKKLVCTAFQAWGSGSPPTPSSMVYLTVIKKAKQKGD
jgi:hypothetical protein